MKFPVLKFCLALLAAVPAVASRIVEDSRTKFVLEDEVHSTEESPCLDLDGTPSLGNHGRTFAPENAFYDDGNGVPYRTYRVALPSNRVPEVSVTDSKLLPLMSSHCSMVDKTRDPLLFSTPSASKPFFKDGLWYSDVRVPLFVKSGRSLALRQNFKLNVGLGNGASGAYPGKRALTGVANPYGAARFGVPMAASRKALRKAGTNPAADVEFLAQFQVGDKNLGSFSEDGLYAVDYKTIRTALLTVLRQDELQGIPVEKLCVYGASPDTLADMGPGEAARNPNHLFEIPIEVRDQTSNGIFDEGDSIVFVGYGNAFWKRADREDPSYVNGAMDYFHSYSPYSFYQYFMLGWKPNGKGLRLDDRLPAVKASGKEINWLRYVRAEKDAILRDTYFGKNLDWESATGKEWFWAWNGPKDTAFVLPSTLMTDETVDLPGLVEGAKGYVAISYFPHRSVWDNERFGGQVPNLILSKMPYESRMDSIFFVLHVNGSSSTSWKGGELDKVTLMPGGNFRMDNAELLPTGNRFELVMLPNGFSYDRFDGYSVAYPWKPAVDSAEWLLPSQVSGVIQVPTPAGTEVMKFKNLQPMGFLTSSNGVAKDSVDASDDVRYLAVKKNVFRPGLKVQGLPSKMDGVISDLSRPNPKLEYLIIAPWEFLSPAVSLAEFRSSGEASSTFVTEVVAAEDIYRRYSGGRMSPVAIRDYIAYVRSVCPDLRYVLLAGSGHFDYRGLNSRLGPIYIPPFEKENSVVEDFFAVLDSGESVQYGVYDIDVSVGRLPVSSAGEFRDYLDKVKSYEKKNEMDFSEWRSSLLFTADDAMNSGYVDRSKHTVSTERIVRSLDSATTSDVYRWNFKKIYLVNYQEDAAGQKMEAAEDLINVLNQGALFTTYFGHGSKTDWASEGLLKASYVSRLNNKGRNTILGSFSCTVGRFDEGNGRSLSEEFLLSSGIGAVASIGAARETLGSLNSEFARGYLLNAVTSRFNYLGDVIRFAKVAGVSTTDYTSRRYNDERYLLLGEPVIQLPVLSGKVRLDETLDTLSALDKVKLSGTVDGIQDGFVDLVINGGRGEHRVDLQLHDDDSVDVFYPGDLIFSEEIPVKNGRFETEFVTPRKLPFGDSTAEIRIWAYSKNSPKISRYWRSDLLVEGMSNYADSLHDTIPPSILIQPCYANAAPGLHNGDHIKLQAPACLQVVVEDSTALDFREQVDEGISFEITGVKDQFHPSPYLEQTSKRAKLRMNFTEDIYPAGQYVFKTRAQDVLGNRSEKMVYLEITDELKDGLLDVYNVPNPMGKKGTVFYFKDLAMQQNLTKASASVVDIFIYNQNGKLVKVIKDAVSGVTRWDGRDNHGRLLANGLYHYVVRSRVPASGNSGKKTFTKKQKLLISR